MYTTMNQSSPKAAGSVAANVMNIARVDRSVKKTSAGRKRRRTRTGRGRQRASSQSRQSSDTTQVWPTLRPASCRSERPSLYRKVAVCSTHSPSSPPSTLSQNGDDAAPGSTLSSKYESAT